MEEIIRELVEEIMGDEIRRRIETCKRDVARSAVEMWYCQTNINDYVTNYLTDSYFNIDSEIEEAVNAVIDGEIE